MLREIEAFLARVSPAAAFSPRKAAMSVYLLDGLAAHERLLAELGPHRGGVGCL